MGINVYCSLVICVHLTDLGLNSGLAGLPDSFNKQGKPICKSGENVKQRRLYLRPSNDLPRVHVLEESQVWHTASVYGLNNVEPPDILQSHLADGLLLQLRNARRTEALTRKVVGLSDQLVDSPIHFDPSILVVP